MSGHRIDPEDYALLPPTAAVLAAFKADLAAAGITGLSEVGPLLAAVVGWMVAEGAFKVTWPSVQSAAGTMASRGEL